MHIAFVNLLIEYYSPENGGALATCIMQQAKRLLRRGHQVSVLTRVGNTATYDIGDVIPIDVRERHEIAPLRRVVSKIKKKLNSWDWPYYDFYVASLSASLAKLKPDAVVCFNDLRVPRYVRQSLPNAQIWVRLSNEVWTLQRKTRHFDNALDGYFAVSDYIRKWAIGRFDLPSKKLVLLQNGCDPESFSPFEGYDSLRVPNAQFPLRVLFVGRINYDKGPDLAVDAVRQLQASGKPVALTVVGSVWWENDPRRYDDYYRCLIKAMTPPAIRHLGHVARGEMPDLFRSHDVVVIPSRWNDPGPQVQFEAMASGCAVIASNRGGISEVIKGVGILIDPQESGAVKAAITRLLDDPEMLCKLKRESLAKATQMTWDRNVDVLERSLTAKSERNE